ncbi:DUF3037 domain-containing protein [Nocardioides convexus]|uniref:DUF3037 domain-containing protein n=1 Tax=Nocardioides convexus TaxID=2712224 RepID=UPI0024182E3D|nr:DUF3037 domain-containing protein [Nocardioides convexus]
MSPYQYVVVRCVPRVEREEFVNVGVVLHCPDADFLDVRSAVDPVRLRALHAEVDLAAVEAGLVAIAKVCRGEAHTDFGVGTRATAYGNREAKDDASTRFGFLKAPRSTVLQPGPVHGGVTADPARTLERLLETLVR